MAEINLKTLTAGVSEIEIFVNEESEGFADATIPLNVDIVDGLTPVVPVSVNLTGNDLTIDVNTSHDINLVDKFGNDLGTKTVSTNANWDLRTLTPYDWADIFLSRETTWGVTGFYTNANVVTAITELVDDLFAANVFQLLYGIYPLVGGTAAKHKWNLAYPFDNQNSLVLNFFNSPIQNWEGVTCAGLGTNLYSCGLTDNPSRLEINSFGHFSAYYRAYTPINNNRDLFVSGDSRNITWHLNDPGAGSGSLRMNWCSPVFQTFPSPPLVLTGHWTLNRPDSANVRQVRNGVVERNIINFSTNIFFDGENNYGPFRWGGGTKTMSAFTLGKGLTPTQELDLYNAIQKFQTTLGRQV